MFMGGKSWPALSGAVVSRLLTSRQVASIAPRAKTFSTRSGFPGLSLVTQPSGHKSWHFAYRAPSGKRGRISCGVFPQIEPQAAIKIVQHFAGLVVAGRDPQGERKARRRGEQEIKQEQVESQLDVFERVAQLYVAKHVQVNLRPSTVRESKRVIEKDLLPAFRGKRLSQLTRVEVRAMLDRIINRGAPSGARLALAHFRGLCGWAVDNDLIITSPCAGIKSRPSKPRDRVLNDNELAAVWQGCDRIPAPFGNIVKLLLLTGCRREEIGGLQWQEIDLDKQVWTLPGDRAKNHRAIQIPLTSKMSDILGGIPRDESGLVFAARSAVERRLLVPYRSVSAFSYGKRALDALMPAKTIAWCWHDLRRSFASGCARLGYEPYLIESALNHRPGGLVSVYQKYDRLNERRDMLEAWGAHVDQLVASVEAKEAA
jgi:integrase